MSLLYSVVIVVAAAPLSQDMIHPIADDVLDDIVEPVDDADIDNLLPDMLTDRSSSDSSVSDNDAYSGPGDDAKNTITAEHPMTYPNSLVEGTHYYRVRDVKPKGNVRAGNPTSFGQVCLKEHLGLSRSDMKAISIWNGASWITAIMPDRVIN